MGCCHNPIRRCQFPLWGPVFGVMPAAVATWGDVCSPPRRLAFDESRLPVRFASRMLSGSVAPSLSRPSSFVWDATGNHGTQLLRRRKSARHARCCLCLVHAWVVLPVPLVDSRALCPNIWSRVRRPNAADGARKMNASRGSHARRGDALWRNLPPVVLRLPVKPESRRSSDRFVAPTPLQGALRLPRPMPAREWHGFPCRDSDRHQPHPRVRGQSASGPARRQSGPPASGRSLPPTVALLGDQALGRTPWDRARCE